MSVRKAPPNHKRVSMTMRIENEHCDLPKGIDECDAHSDAERSSATLASKVSESSSPVGLSVGALSGASTSRSKPHNKIDPATSQIHLTTRLLRKSASADSCINQRISSQSEARSEMLRNRHDASARLNEPRNTQPERSDTRALSSPSSAMSLTGLLRARVGRRRGTSNANTTDNDASAHEDSDFDKPNPSSGTVKNRMRARLLSLRSSKTSGSGSEAFDVPRLPERGASASLSNLKALNQSSSKLSSKSVNLSHEVGETLAKEKRRARSHSVGPPSRNTTSKFAKRFSFGNQAPQKPENLREISIAVVGPTGCGKSTFIRKGLRKHDLSRPESFSATVSAGEMSRNVDYIRRYAHLLTEFNTETNISVYEYDSLNWKTDKKSPLLSVWPKGLPPADGIFVCYDGSDRESFVDVIQLVSGYKAIGIPTLVIACKADLEKRVPPEDAATVIDPYSKLVEVSNYSDEGKRRMRKAVDRLVRQATALQAPSNLTIPNADRQSGFSSDKQPPMSVRATDLSNLLQTKIPPSPIDLASPTTPPLPSTGQFALPQVISPPLMPTSVRRSPMRVGSMNDILDDHKKPQVSSLYESDKESTKMKSGASLSSSTTKSSESLVNIASFTRPTSMTIPKVTENETCATCINCSDIQRQRSKSPPTPWVTLDELLEKLFFLAISGDDPSFISHFFLTYRRFATPRSILLGMQKRLNELRQPAGDVTLACFAQMRICNLLEQWMREYPTDFAVPGTHGALHAIIRHILAYSHTLSYGSDFLSFMEILGTVCDEDASWAFEGDVCSLTESDTEAESTFDADPVVESDVASPVSLLSPKTLRLSTSEAPSSPRSSVRERRSSLPLSAMALIKTPILNAFHNVDERSGSSRKEIVSKLQRTAAALSNYEADSIAKEITQRDLQLFLKIRPRDWLRHTFTPGKKNPNSDPIARFNANYNDLHEWTVSLILCHDKPKGRARQIEKFADVASRLRMMNNYSALRALITAINQATYPGDQSMEIFKTRVDLHKKFLSSDILLRTTGAHQSYRMALRNTKGPCIPSLEVHTSDLRRAHEGNADAKLDDPSKFNWAKYNMMGRFIATTTAIQQRCTGPDGYKLTENRYLSQLFDIPVMDYEMQQGRMTQPPEDDSSLPGSSTNFAASHSKESSVIKRILQW